MAEVSVSASGFGLILPRKYFLYEKSPRSNFGLIFWRGLSTHLYVYKCSNDLWMLMAVCAAPGVKSVSMRDMGTEMTPMASQEPSRTGTPNGASTPSRSPVCSQPSTPRGAAQAAVAAPPTEVGSEKALDARDDGGRAELSEKERRQKTRSEILALGLQLGKMNIAAWASKGDVENDSDGRAPCEGADQARLRRVDFEARAAAWEEAEKTRHTARSDDQRISEALY